MAATDSIEWGPSDLLADSWDSACGRFRIIQAGFAFILMVFEVNGRRPKSGFCSGTFRSLDVAKHAAEQL